MSSPRIGQQLDITSGGRSRDMAWVAIGLDRRRRFLSRQIPSPFFGFGLLEKMLGLDNHHAIAFLEEHTFSNQRFRQFISSSHGTKNGGQYAACQRTTKRHEG